MKSKVKFAIILALCVSVLLSVDFKHAFAGSLMKARITLADFGKSDDLGQHILKDASIANILEANYEDTIAVKPDSNPQILAEEDTLPLYKGTNWRDLGSKKKNITISNKQSMNLNGNIFESGPFVGKQSNGLVDYYLSKNMTALGWDLIAYYDNLGLFYGIYYYKDRGLYLGFAIGSCKSNFFSESSRKNDLYNECAQVWISDETEYAPSPSVTQEENTTPSVSTLASYQNPLSVPGTSQQNPSWSGDRLGYPDNGYPNACDPYTIGGYGCVISAYSSLYNYYSPNFTNPPIMNNNLSTGSIRYLSNGAHCNDLFPINQTPYAPTGVSWGERRYNSCTSANCIDSGNISYIDNELNAGRPLHARIHWTGCGASESCHSVLITGHIGNTYYIMDPGDGQQHTLTTGYYGNHAYVVDYIDRINGSPPSGGPPSGFELCTNEGGRCDFSGTADIAYGANGSFYYKYGVSDGIDCNNNVFGDPIPGTSKACYIKGGGPPDYTFCSNENERCNFRGTADVAYGASLKYNYKYGVTSGIDCNNSNFGDPIYGTAKACYYKSTAPALPDLKPIAPSGYPYPVVPSSIKGTHDVNTLYEGQDTYFDWHFTNDGTETATGSFYIELWVDNVRLIQYRYSDVGVGSLRGFDDWGAIIAAPGWHTVKLVTDPDNSINESDEANNVWEHQFYWESICATPDSPTLLYPLIGAAINDSTPTLDWDSVTDANEYELQVASDESFGNIILNTTTAATQFTPSIPLDDGLLYWRVRGLNNANGCSVAGHWIAWAFMLDTVRPDIRVIPPEGGSYLNAGLIDIMAEASDAGTGINSVKFYVYHDEISWDPVGEDSNGEDGWQVTWDATSIGDQRIYLRADAIDFAGNTKSAYDWDVAIDRTAPTCAVDTLASISPRTFSVSWAGNDALSGIEAYDVQYRDNGSAWADWVQGETATSGSFVGEPGHTYGFQCRAQDAAGNIGSYSDLPDTSTAIALDIPGDANGDGEVSGIDYTIWLNHYNQKTDNGVSDGDFNLDGVVSGIDYGIWLLNYGSSFSSATAGTTSSTMQLSAYTASVAPSSPGNLSLSYENNDTGTAMLVHLSWNDNADNEEGFKISFDVEGLGSNIIDTLANPPDTTVRSETTQSDLVVIPCETADRSVTMIASISAFNTDGASDPVSISKNIVVPACRPVPVRPTQLTATVISDSQIDVDWTDNSTNESGFKIERSLDESTWTEVTSVGANITTYSDIGLSSGTQYFYEVCAFNDAGASCSDTVNATTLGSRTILVPQDYLTISQAMDFAQSGDTIEVSEGTYNETISVKPGVKLLSANPQNTIIDGGTSDVVVYIGGDSEISGFIIMNSGPDWWDAGIWITEGSPLVSRNIVVGNSMGIVSYCYSSCSGQPRIENNIVFQNQADGILAHNIAPIILNNTVVQNGNAGIAVDTAGTILTNNISSENGAVGIVGNYADVQADYNTVWNNPENYSGVTPGPNDISADSKFVSPSVYDFHLKADSPNIDAGGLAEGLVMDIDGEDRPYDGDGDGTPVVDIGADEYVGPPSLSPPPPSDLAATGVTQQQIDLIWVDNSANENGFEIKRSLDGSEYAVIASVGIDVTSFSDTGLSPNTTYSYKVCAFNEVGSSCSDVVTAKTLISLPPPSNLAAAPISESQIDLAWSDNSDNEDGFRIHRVLDSNNGWGLVAEIGADSSIYSDMGLDSATTYYYKVCAFKGADEACSPVASGTTFDPPASNDQIAFNELLLAGSLSGGYQDTTANDGVAEVIEEQESGGKPAKRYSYLEHKWIFDVQPGSSITFNANAWASASSDGDSFIFAYSVDDVNYTDMFAISANDDDDRYQTYLLPSSTVGTVYIQIVDTDRTSGNRSLDRVSVDHMFIRIESAPGNPPSPPSDLSATAVSASQIDLSWSDNSTDENGFQIERSLNGSTWEALGTTVADVTTYADMNLQANTSYTYRVLAYNASGSSIYSNTASATTQQAGFVHVGDLDGRSSPANRGRWDATVSITVHDANEQLIVGATVQGEWSGGVVGTDSCITDNNGRCNLVQANIKGNVDNVTFTVIDVTFGANIYQSADNHEPDGDSDGTSITIYQP
jgi:hypothetical protein